MSDANKTKIVPDAYQGREQAYIKHELLKGYLEKLFLIVGMSARKLGITELCYVDCFAGPWADESEDFSGTSIAVSLQQLDICRQALGRSGMGLRVRALYIEKDRRAHSRLENYLAKWTPPGIKTEARLGDFVELREEILSWCGDGPFVFFFIDPTGWKEVGIEVLHPLLQRPQSEFLINFMYDFVNRTISMPEWTAEIAALLGEDIEVEGLPPADREKALLNTYRKNLKHYLPTGGAWPARSAYVRVLDRKKKRPKYHLVYLTGHPRGVIEFMQVSESLDLIQKRVRASTKESARAEKSGIEDLFGAESFVNPDEGHAGVGEVEECWLNYLSKGVNRMRRVDEAEFANLLEDTDWFPGDFQRALGGLINAGKVCNLDAPRKRPKRPLHWEYAERLQLMEGSQ